MGWTSHDVVAVVRRQLGTRAVGHTGTLDPFATGLLIVLVGKATRLARFVEGMTKQYRAVVRFGSATDTDDSTGQAVRELQPEAWPDLTTIAAQVASLTGAQLQRPPAYSAKHVAGTRSHRLARRGEAVELAEVSVLVQAIEVLNWAPPDLAVDATVGRGTYLRSLARDLGERVGIPAHCAVLRRTAIGRFEVSDAIDPREASVKGMISPADLVRAMPTEVLDAAAAVAVGHGRSVPQQVPVEVTGALVAGDGRLLAVAEGRSGSWHPTVVLEPAT